MHSRLQRKSLITFLYIGCWLCDLSLHRLQGASASHDMKCVCSSNDHKRKAALSVATWKQRCPSYANGHNGVSSWAYLLAQHISQSTCMTEGWVHQVVNTLAFFKASWHMNSYHWLLKCRARYTQPYSLHTGNGRVAVSLQPNLCGPQEEENTGEKLSNNTAGQASTQELTHHTQMPT